MSSFFGSKLFGNSKLLDNDNGSSTKAISSTLSNCETIERLCDRIHTSSLIEDRRDSLKQIKLLSTKFKLDVGTQAMHVLIDVIKSNKDDIESLCLSLETLNNILNKKNPNGTPDEMLISTQFSEMFLKEQCNLELLLNLLDEYIDEFSVRWSTVKLLDVLTVNVAQRLQELVVQVPRGVSRLVDLLNDSREIIRNDAILLLTHLLTQTQVNLANIQKIIAFESGFDRLIEIVDGEGESVIVEDCFRLLLNLLNENHSNQTYFIEANNLMKKLCGYFNLTSMNNQLLQKQTITNQSLLLDVFRCLVSPVNPHQQIVTCQRVYAHLGLLHRLCAAIMMPSLTSDFLAHVITTVAQIIRGNEANQQLFSSIQMSAQAQNQTRPLLIILLMTMINEKQSFGLRCSILYLFECFLFKNEAKKSQMVESLVLANALTSSNGEINAGQLLCSGLFSSSQSQQDFVSTWLCACALSHCIRDNLKLKEQLLGVHLAIGQPHEQQKEKGQEQVVLSLMQQCMNSIIRGKSGNDMQRFQTKCALLMFLSTWLVSCPKAVAHFLQYEENVLYLISQVSSTDTEETAQIVQGLSAFILGLTMLFNTIKTNEWPADKLKDTLKKRIGFEHFGLKLEYISQHDAYCRTLKKNTTTSTPQSLLFDYEFTRLFKANESLIINVLFNENTQDEYPLLMETIKIQQLKLDEQVRLNKALEYNLKQMEEYCAQFNQNNVQNVQNAFLTTEKLQMQAKINELEVKCNLLEEKCSEQEDELCKLQREKGTWQETLTNIELSHTTHVDLIEVKTQNKLLKQRIDDLNKEQVNLLLLLQEMESKKNLYKKKLKSESKMNQEMFSSSSPSSETESENVRQIKTEEDDEEEEDEEQEEFSDNLEQISNNIIKLNNNFNQHSIEIKDGKNTF